MPTGAPQVRVEQHLNGVSYHFFRGIAENLAHFGVDMRNPALEVDVHDAEWRVIERRAVSLGGLIAFSDVDDGADQARDTTVGAGECGLVVNRVTAPRTRSFDGRLEYLSSGTAPQQLIHRVPLIRHFRVVRIEIVHRFADERLPG